MPQVKKKMIKSPAVKKPVKTAKKIEPKIKQPITKGLSLPLYDITGKTQGQITLPKEKFGQEPNMNLLAQAFRVYFANSHPKTASTKTRGQVRGGGRKPHKQKGTGNARAGSIRSPLWVGGGTTFGPQPTKSLLSLPKKMKHKALIYALSLAQKEGAIKVVTGFEKMQSKTKVASDLLKKINITGKTLVVLENPKSNVNLAIRNIPKIGVDVVKELNAFKILSAKNVIFERSAIDKI